MPNFTYRKAADYFGLAWKMAYGDADKIRKQGIEKMVACF